MIFCFKELAFYRFLELFWFGCSNWPENVSALTRSAKSNLETSEIIANRHQPKEQDAPLNLKCYACLLFTDTYLFVLKRVRGERLCVWIQLCKGECRARIRNPQSWKLVTAYNAEACQFLILKLLNKKNKKNSKVKKRRELGEFKVVIYK